MKIKGVNGWWKVFAIVVAITLWYAKQTSDISNLQEESKTQTIQLTQLQSEVAKTTVARELVAYRLGIVEEQLKEIKKTLDEINKYHK